MKTIKIHLKVVALFFSVLIFFQGCTVYKSAAVSLEEAVNANTVTKIKMTDDRTIRYEKVLLENDKYYGILHSRQRLVKTLINRVFDVSKK